jgi:hypothetical protein
VAFSLPIDEDFMVKLMGKMEERAIAREGKMEERAIAREGKMEERAIAREKAREERIKTFITEQIEVAITELGK